jgi:peptidoglycan/xylan/chitin deacetylase (PgdA/CDA1 family)
LLEIGGFDETLDRSEDVELAYRLEEAGLEIGFVRGAGGEQVHAKGFREIVRDFDRAGTAAVALWRKHPAMVDHAPLGDFSQGGARAILARRLLLALRAPVWPLAVVDPLLAGRPSERLYRFLQLHCFWRSLRPALDDRETWRRLTRGPVILRYRALAAAGEPPSRYVIPEGRFRRQLAWMRLRRRPILSLDEYVDLRVQRRLPPARSVIVTFDDGYADVERAAAPSLRRARAPATMFVVTGAAGGRNDWTRSGPVSGRELLSWDGIRRLVKTGFTVGSHAIEHVDLAAIDIASARRQIGGAADELDRRVHPGLRILSYPYGRSNEAVRQAAVDLGFAGAVGTAPGPNGPAVPLHDLRRMEVWGTRPLHRFILDLWLGIHLGSPDRTGRRGG